MENTYTKLTKAEWTRLIEVSKRQAPASLSIKGAQYLNVYTGKVMSGNIALSGKRIAYVGEKDPMVDDSTQIIDAKAHILVPGYIEPHSHPFQMYNPIALVEYALSRGTTTMLHDNLNFFVKLSQSDMERFFEKMAQTPAKNFWWARLDPQNNDPELLSAFTPERVERTLSHPLVLQAGELTAWKEVLDGDEGMRERMYLARLSQKRIETHNPGASVETLNAVTAAGVTGCHESITAEDVLRRIQLGLYATLRQSSIRPDLAGLVQGLLDQPPSIWERTMLTTDGSAPFYLEAGFTDYLLKIAMEAGLPPERAYRMATLNPAVYYGLDQHLGGIAPGRIADILFLEDLSNPTPVRMIANGEILPGYGDALNLQDFAWDEFGFGPLDTGDWHAQPEWFPIEAQEKVPVVEMLNAVILAQRNEKLPEKDGFVNLDGMDDYLYAALIDVEGKWISTGIVKGFANVDGLASSYSVAPGFMVLGRDPVQMAAAVNQVKSVGGGICLYENGAPLFELPLPMLGVMSGEKMDRLIDLSSRLFSLLKDRGYRHEDPFYSLLFFTATSLPSIRFGRRGLISVKTGEIVTPAKQL